MSTLKFMPSAEPTPSLRLRERTQPFQKITINRMPTLLYNQLEQRANRLNKSVAVYCRVVLEHAINHQSDYSGGLKNNYPHDSCYPKAINIPIADKTFLTDLFDWDPYGVCKRTLIALSILKKHLEVRTW
jgi:hypothetical protein